MKTEKSRNKPKYCIERRYDTYFIRTLDQKNMPNYYRLLHSSDLIAFNIKDAKKMAIRMCLLDIKLWQERILVMKEQIRYLRELEAKDFGCLEITTKGSK